MKKLSFFHWVASRADPRTIRVPSFGFQVPNFEIPLSGFGSKTQRNFGLEMSGGVSTGAGFRCQANVDGVRVSGLVFAVRASGFGVRVSVFG